VTKERKSDVELGIGQWPLEGDQRVYSLSSANPGLVLAIGVRVSHQRSLYTLIQSDLDCLFSKVAGHAWVGFHARRHVPMLEQACPKERIILVSTLTMRWKYVIERHSFNLHHGCQI